MLNTTEAREYVKKWFAETNIVKILIQGIVVLGIVIGKDPLAKALDIYQDREKFEMETERKINDLELRMMEQAYYDSVSQIIETSLIDISLSAGFSSYQILENLVNKSSADRAIIFAASNDISLNKPTFGKILGEIKLPPYESIKKDWEQNTYIMPGMRVFLDRTRKTSDILTIINVASDSSLSRPLTRQYMQKIGVKSIMCCYIGKNPIMHKYYFLITFYHKDFLLQLSVDNDLYRTRAACLAIKEMFSFAN